MATDKKRYWFTVDGVRYSVYASNDREAGKKIAEKTQKIHIKESFMRLKEWADFCIDTYKVNCAENTLQHLRWVADKCVINVLGNVPIRTVRTVDCQRCLNACKGKSKAHIKYVHDMLRFLFHRALVDGLIQEDPTLHLVKPKGTEGHRRACTKEEREAVIEVGKTQRRYYVYLLMMLCGCRPSEAYEVKGEDIKQIDGRPFLHIRGTKTERSDRLVPIPKELYQIIKKTALTGYVSPTDGGNKQGNNSKRAWEHFRYHLDRYLGSPMYRNAIIESKTIGLTPYCLRHEYCTELARKGIDIRTAQKLMGHSSINLTANIYTNLEVNDIAKDVILFE